MNILKNLDLRYVCVRCFQFFPLFGQVYVSFTFANCVCLMSAPVFINFDSSR